MLVVHMPHVFRRKRPVVITLVSVLVAVILLGLHHTYGQATYDIIGDAFGNKDENSETNENESTDMSADMDMKVDTDKSGTLTLTSTSTSTWTQVQTSTLMETNSALESSLAEVGVSDPQAFYRRMLYSSEFDPIKKFNFKEHMLRKKYGSGRGEFWDKVESVDYFSFKPSISWSLYLEEFEKNGVAGDVRFSWYDWLDFEEYNKLLSLEKTKLDCKFLCSKAFPREQLFTVEEEIGEKLFEWERNLYEDENWCNNMVEKAKKDTPENQWKPEYCKVDGDDVKVLGLYDRVRPEVYHLQARSYILYSNPNPISVTIMDGDKRSFQFGVKKREESGKHMIANGMYKQYLDKYDYTDDSVEFDHIEMFKRVFSKKKFESKTVTIEELPDNKYDEILINLSHSDFEFDARGKIEELEGRSEKLSGHEKNYLESLKYSVNTHYALVTKYLNEGNHIDGFYGHGHHFEWRFFNKPSAIDPDEMTVRLNSLARNFFKFTKANGLVAWAAHGSLYGYMYDGRSFPWDDDFDVQMPIRHLNLMAQYFNQSVILEDPSEGNGRFFLDISSSITTRIKGNGLNNIDARFIDMDSGLFIDITGLSVSSGFVKKLDSYYKSKVSDETKFNVDHKDPNLIEGKTDLSLEKLYEEMKANSDNYSSKDIENVGKLLKSWNDNLKKENSPEKDLSTEQRYSTNYDLQLYNCRNNHFLTLDMLTPLVRSKFHGVDTLVPLKHVSMLKNEYAVPKGYQFISYKDNVFLPQLQAWIKRDLLKSVLTPESSDKEASEAKTKGSKLELSDMVKFYEEMASKHLSIPLASLYRSFDIRTYRLKELEIMNSKSFNDKEKLSWIEKLEETVGPRLGSPSKDPYAYLEEKTLWNAEKKDKKEEFERAIQAVDEQIAAEMVEYTYKLAQKELDLFQVNGNGNDKAPEADLDFNNVGDPFTLFGSDNNNVVFEKDLELHLED